MGQATDVNERRHQNGGNKQTGHSGHGHKEEGGNQQEEDNEEGEEPQVQEAKVVLEEVHAEATRRMAAGWPTEASRR